MKCMIVDPDETPELSKSYDLKYALTISNMQDVVDNAKIQAPNSDMPTLIRALKYYYDNDAFINF